jgi:hypothetical protein
VASVEGVSPILCRVCLDWAFLHSTIFPLIVWSVFCITLISTQERRKTIVSQRVNASYV